MKKLYEETNVQAIADAIRAKTGKTDKMKIAEMSGEIEGIDTQLDAIIDKTVVNFRNDTVTKLGSGVFYRCTALKSLECSSVKTIDYMTCLGCTALKVLSLPSLTYVGNQSFTDCISLTSLDFNELENIHYHSFYGCSKLTTLIIRASNVCSSQYSSNFTNTPIASGTGYIYVPSALVDSYKTATNWSVYADQFRALEDYTVDGTTTGELDESKI